jgi:hypothetical protein
LLLRQPGKMLFELFLRIPPPRYTAQDDSGVAAVEFEEAEVVAAETEGP